MCMATDVLRHGLHIACMPTTSLSYVMVVHYSTSTMGNASAHHITSSRRTWLDVVDKHDGGVEKCGNRRAIPARYALTHRIFL